MMNNSSRIQKMLDEEFLKLNPDLSQVEKYKILFIHNKLTKTPHAWYAAEELDSLNLFLTRMAFVFTDTNPTISAHEGVCIGMMITMFKTIQNAYNASLHDTDLEKYATEYKYCETVWEAIPNFKKFLGEHIPDVLILGYNIHINDAYSKKDSCNNYDEKYIFNDYYVTVESNE